MAQALPKNLAAALAFGAGSSQKVRRSEYLTDALREMQKYGSQPITGGVGEAAARLAALWVTKRSSDKANREALEAVSADRSARADAILASLKGETSLPPPEPAAMQAPPPPPTQAPLPPPTQAPALASAVAPAAASPDLASLWPALERQESGGRQEAVSPKGAFGVAQLMPGTAAALAAQAGDPTLADRARTDPDVNRQLGQTYLRQQLEKYQLPELALAAYNAGPGRVDEWIQRFGDPRTGQISPQAWAAQIPFSETREYVATIMSGRGSGPVASNPGSALPPVMPQQPSPPMSPQVGGGAPAGAPTAPPGGQAAPAAGYWRPNARQLAWVEGLLSDPRTYEQGMAEAMKLREKMNNPPEYTVQTINGVPFYVSKTPGQGGQPIMIPVPPQALTEVMAAQAAGITSAPNGVFVQRDPLGNVKEVPGGPPQGYQVQGDGYAPIKNGPADPNAPQKPAQGYRNEDGRQQVIPGGPAAMETERQLRTDFEKDPLFRGYGRAVSIFNSMKDQLAVPGRIADINYVYGLATIFDPDSVVREGEQVVIRNSQALPDWLVGQINKVNGGQGIQYETRAQMLESAGSRLSGMRDQVRSRADFNGQLAQRYGLDPRNVTPALPAFEPWSRQGAGAPGAAPPAAQFAPSSVDAAIQRAIQMGRPELLSPRQQQRARELGLIR